ncbi:30S ribosomal protein S12 methylthiotransferase RimO [bacterium]|nr:30S ribosomal protein S12 methylthiotransferase RimO [candidate division CSSED10-310 bacterium]
MKSRNDAVADPVKTVALASLGCVKNTEDSEYILGRLKRAGFVFTARPEEADAIIVNTCGFIESARDESLQVIRDMNGYRARGRLKRLIVAGCMADLDRDLVHREAPFVDGFLSPFRMDRIERLVSGKIRSCRRSAAFPPPGYHPSCRRVRITPAAYAYVKIADGCDNRCSFCRIPAIRGPYRSKHPASVLREMKSLARAGTREVILISQDNTRYGRDRSESPGLAGLLDRLADLQEIYRIRLLYLHPDRIDPTLLNCIFSHDRICNYLDVPLQHVNRGVLKSMGRTGNPDGYRRLVETIRGCNPDVALRTTFITGFPGESVQAFSELEAFVAKGWFDHVGVFVYSPEPGTPAESLTRDVSPQEADFRRERLMLIQQDHLQTRNSRFLNRVVEVLVDESDPKMPGCSLARMDSQAPDIDTVVHVSGDLPSGTVLPVLIRRAEPYDFFAEPLPADRAIS